MQGSGGFSLCSASSKRLPRLPRSSLCPLGACLSPCIGLCAVGLSAAPTFFSTLLFALVFRRLLHSAPSQLLLQHGLESFSLCGLAFVAALVRLGWACTLLALLCVWLGLVGLRAFPLLPPSASSCCLALTPPVVSVHLLLKRSGFCDCAPCAFAVFGSGGLLARWLRHLVIRPSLAPCFFVFVWVMHRLACVCMVAGVVVCLRSSSVSLWFSSQRGSPPWFVAASAETHSWWFPVVGLPLVLSCALVSFFLALWCVPPSAFAVTPVLWLHARLCFVLRLTAFLLGASGVSHGFWAFSSLRFPLLGLAPLYSRSFFPPALSLL